MTPAVGRVHAAQEPGHTLIFELEHEWTGPRHLHRRLKGEYIAIIPAGRRKTNGESILR